MTYGRIINGFKYIRLMNSNNFKFNTLNDNVYFTLRDIFANADSADTVMEANDFNSRLTGGVSFEDRTRDFVYTNVLEQKYFVEKLLLWLKYFNIHFFEFIDPEPDEEIDINEYLPWDIWWTQFEKLKYQIEEQYKKCCIWDVVDVGPDI